MSTLKLKTPAGGSISLTPTDTASDVTLTLPASTTSLVDSASLAASGGSALVGYLPAGTGAVATTVQTKLRESVSVKDFGAIGDGIADDTAAIQAAITYALTATNPGASTNPMLAIHFPAGVYIVDNNVLSGALSRQVSGALFTGDGWFASVLRFKPSLAATSYMLDETNKLQFAVFQNLGFEGTTPTNYSAGTVPANANFIRQNSSGFSQGLKFVSCRIAGFQKVLECVGTNTASENKFINCKITHIGTYVLGLNNQQSLNHEFVSTDIEVILGDIFYINSGSGGAIHVFGGSIIPLGSGSCAVLRMVGSLISHGIQFYGTRFELRSASVLAVMPNNAVGSATFNQCSIYNTESSGSRDIVSVGTFASLAFNGCEFPSNGAASTYRLVGTNQYGESGRLIFDSCRVSSSLSDAIVFSGAYGRATARGCYPMDYGSVSAEPFITAIDFDLGGAGCYDVSGYKDASANVKRIWVKPANNIWPKSNGAGGSANDLTIKLPKNAIITKIVLRKYAGGSAAATYTLQVTNSDKTVTHGTSNTANQLLAHSLTVNDYYYDVGTTDNERIIRVSVTGATTGTQNLSGGFGFIEYL
jgi:hypothetical protein